MSDQRLEDELQQWIEGLLRTGTVEKVAPLALHQRVEQSRRRKRWRIPTACVFAAAASLVIAMLWVPVGVDCEVVSATPATARGRAGSLPVAPSRPVATFVATSDFIAIPIESDDPTVTIVQLYPTTLARQRWRLEAAYQAILSQTESQPTHSVRGG